jgi:hypothetical protein
LFSVQAASSAVTESRLMGVTGATVNDADGVVGERGVGSAHVGARCARMYPSASAAVGLPRVGGQTRRPGPGRPGASQYADARAAARERLTRRRFNHGTYYYSAVEEAVMLHKDTQRYLGFTGSSNLCGVALSPGD